MLSPARGLAVTPVAAALVAVFAVTHVGLLSLMAPPVTLLVVSEAGAAVAGPGMTYCPCHG